MASINPIDRSHLEKYTGDDAALFDEILTIFIDRARELVASLDPGDVGSGWRDLCHALKGASRGVGAWAVGDLAEIGEPLQAIDERARLLFALVEEVEAAVAFAHTMRESTR